MGRNYAGVDGLAGACTFRHPRATPEQIVSVFLAGLLGERLISPHTDIEAANTDAHKRLRSLRMAWISTRSAAKTRQRIYNLWTEVARLAEALDKHGSSGCGRDRARGAGCHRLRGRDEIVAFDVSPDG